MSSLTVTPGQLESLGATTHQTCAGVRAEHQHLRAQLSPLFGADWSGAASAQFGSLFGDFEQHARGLCDALDGIATLLSRAGTAYADVEAQVTASFR